MESWIDLHTYNIYVPGKRNQVEKVDKFSKALWYIISQIFKQLLIDPFGLLETSAGRRSQVWKDFRPQSLLKRFRNTETISSSGPESFLKKRRVFFLKILRFFFLVILLMGKKPAALEVAFEVVNYCWWLKSCTRKIGSLSQYLQGFIHPRWLAGFLPSTISTVSTGIPFSQQESNRDQQLHTVLQWMFPLNILEQKGWWKPPSKK